MESKTIKIVIWHVLVLVFALSMWAGGNHVEFNSLTGIDIQIPSFGAFLTLVSIIGLGFIFFRGPGQYIWPLTASIIVGGLFILEFGFNSLNLLASLIFIPFSFVASSRVGSELNERVKINISSFLRNSLMPIVLGIMLMISFAVYQSPLADQIKDQSKLPDQVQQFFQTIVNKTFGSKIDAPNKTDRQKTLNEIGSQAYSDINGFLKPYFQYAPPILAFGLFLILWGFSWLFVLLSALIGMFLFWLLKKTGAIKIAEKDIKAETLIV